MKQYDPKTIEPKWQQLWRESDIYAAREGGRDRKSYILDFFPYPSGATMHVGHVRNYVISDAVARYKRQTGHTVLHPMGWDAFGLPAENYAIKTGISPKVTTKRNTETFKEQLQQIGTSYDWNREIDSSDPAYYKWTQWFFLLLHSRGLAYQKESMQWWCETDQTVLADEQVENGLCWRCGNPVTKKALKQWFFKITEYADRLIDDLDTIDWPQSIKSMQRNWIGRSEGAQVDFETVGTEHTITVFTTRPDTLFGATYMVLAPEHPLVDELVTDGQKEAVEEYRESALLRSEIDRMDESKEKTGVFIGAYATNPVNQEQIPIWISDYVLMGYGTGAIMAVPAHDQRDFEFARKFDLPVKEVVTPVTGKPQHEPEYRRSIVAIVENEDGELLSIDWGKDGGSLFIGGGIDEDESTEAAARREITEETGYTELELVGQTGQIIHNYYAYSKKVARRIEAYGLHFKLTGDNQQEPELEKDEKDAFKPVWISAEQAESAIKDELHRRVLEGLVLGRVYTGEGIMVNSEKYDGLDSHEVREKIVGDYDALRPETTYKLRDWLISRQRYWGAPIPMIHCGFCGAVPVPESDLPVELPDIESYQPSGDGQSPLARVDEFVNVDCPQCGKPAKRETDTMDGFACSSWYFLRFADPDNDEAPFAKDLAEYWLPVDTYIGGAEHAVMHLLYARFWTKVMQDEGLVSFPEPFHALRNQGMILAPDGQKMSKSKGNTITPDELIDSGYGADSLRLMELFIAPYNQETPWQTEGIVGTFRFLNRVWTLAQEFVASEDTKTVVDNVTELEARGQVVLHRTIKKVTEDLENMNFNTAVAALMELTNELYKLREELPFGAAHQVWRETLAVLIKLLAPFAPHITEELWSDLGQEQSVHVSHWPVWDDDMLEEAVVTIAVQINGKVRTQVLAPKDAGKEELAEVAKRDERIAGLLEGKTIKKTIAVPGRIVNFVVD